MNRLSVMAGCVLFAVAVPADEGNPVVERGRIGLSTSFTTVPDAQYYARTCEHRTNGTFSACVLADPVLREEWHVDEDQPTYTWSGIDGTASGRGNSALSVNLSGVGASYGVVVTATWALTKDDGETATTAASRAMTFDAIRYDFRALPPGIDGRGENQLVDSQEATLQVTATGCTQTDSLSLSPRSEPKPEPGVSPQNEVNDTEMTFICRGNPLLWEIPCPYWYGGSPTGEPPACCYSNAAKYELSLNPDGCNEHRQEVSVHLPSADFDSFMHPKCEPAKITRGKLETIETNGVLTYRLRCSVADFVPRGFVSCGATSQYRKKIKEEEHVHRKQFERENGYGFEDLFSLEDVFKTLGLKPAKEIFIEGETLDHIETILAMYEKAIDAEMEISWRYWGVNQDYQESTAKALVGFGEAYRYHCCYGRSEGHQLEPIKKIAKEPSEDKSSEGGIDK